MGRRLAALILCLVVLVTAGAMVAGCGRHQALREAWLRGQAASTEGTGAESQPVSTGTDAGSQPATPAVTGGQTDAAETAATESTLDSLEEMLDDLEAVLGQVQAQEEDSPGF